jgi:dTMP kinase
LTGFSNNRGVLISFEGIDASGKNTQAKLLCDSLKRNHLAFEFLSFPVYSTPIGSEIKNYLARKREYALETIHSLYSANRYEFKSIIERWISQGSIVVLNRYCESNIAYGVADGLPRAWLEQLESRMPQSDYVFYLRISHELSLQRKVSRDRFEEDLKFLARVSQVYDTLAMDPRWITVDAERDVEIIRYEIEKTLTALLEERAKGSTESEMISNYPKPRQNEGNPAMKSVKGGI